MSGPASPPRLSRRLLLKGGLAAGFLVAGGAGLALSRGSVAPGLKRLTTRERDTIAAMAEAWFPARDGVPGAAAVDVAGGVDAYVASLPDLLGRLTKLLVRAIEYGAYPVELARFSALPVDGRLACLDAWENSALYARRMGFVSLKLAVGMAYFDDPRVRAAIGWTECVPERRPPTQEWL
jgi:hypothetical protein